MHAPSLLILDEPSDGVDPIGRRQIRDILHALEQQGVKELEAADLTACRA